MAKNGKKRRLLVVDTDQVHWLSNVTGLGELENQESLDDCLAELKQSATAPPTSKPLAAQSNHAGGSHALEVDLPEISSIIFSHATIDLDQIETWNRSFLSWTRGGLYVPGLLPCLEEELARNFKVQELSSFVLKTGEDLRMPIFERWIIDSKLEERDDHDARQNDPVLPHKASLDSEASQRLVGEICQGNVTRDNAEKAVAELCRKCNLSAQEISAQSHLFGSQAPLKKGDRVALEDRGTALSIIFSRKKWKKPFVFKLNKEHYHKLRDRMLNVHNQAATKIEIPNCDKADKSTHAFHILILSLLLRYSALSGGQLLQDLRGGGMQGAIHDRVFDVLSSSILGEWVEGFASPFNSYLPRFASAFPNLEWHFGSVGNFMDCSFVQGCFELNPPFSPGFMTGMVDRILADLQKANMHDKSLTFAVVVPTANRSSSQPAVVKQAASESFSRMVSCCHCRLHSILPAREHGYMEGSQHLRPTKYKESNYDTSVILLQSKKASQHHVDLERLETELKIAFASRHADELVKRRKVN